MAIEIIPKPRVKVPPWVVIILLVCLILLVGVFGGYFYLSQSSKQLSQKIQDTKSAIAKLISDNKPVEQELLAKEKKINLFDALLSSHMKSFNILIFLEKICHSRVWFNSFSFSSQNALTVNMTGEAENFVALGQQMMILKKETSFKKINLAGVSLGAEGRVTFSLQLTFDPQVVK